MILSRTRKIKRVVRDCYRTVQADHKACIRHSKSHEKPDSTVSHKTQPTGQAHASVSSVYIPFHLSIVNPGVTISSSLNISRAFRLSLFRTLSYIPWYFSILSERGDATISKLEALWLTTLHSPKNERSSMTVFVTCNLRIVSAVWMATASRPVIIVQRVN